MRRSVLWPASPLAALLLLPLLLARAPPPVTEHTITPEMTDEPEEEDFEIYAEDCMHEGNVTEEEVHTAFDNDPNHAPYVLKCIWGCMYRKVGLLVDGNLPDEMPGEPIGDRLREFEELKNNCADKVAAASDECEKGAVLRDCAAEVTTVTPV